MCSSCQFQCFKSYNKQNIAFHVNFQLGLASYLFTKWRARNHFVGCSSFKLFNHVIKQLQGTDTCANWHLCNLFHCTFRPLLSILFDLFFLLSLFWHTVYSNKKIVSQCMLDQIDFTVLWNIGIDRFHCTKKCWFRQVSLYLHFWGQNNALATLKIWYWLAL